VRPEPACAELRRDLSARLDGEIDAATETVLEAHLESCRECRDYEAELRQVRRTLRLAPAENVPNLTAAILQRVTVEHDSRRRRNEWKLGIRTAAVAAAATAAVLLGAGAPWVERPTDVAGADEIVAEVRAAASSLDAYRATYTITERGWHPRIEGREMRARVWFDAPESFRIEIDDRTDYPSRRWPRNDVSIVATPDRYWISEPVSCPVETLPDCADPSARRHYTELQRTPFDGSTRFPTDVAVPLETVAASRGFDVLGEVEVAGHQAVHIELAYRDAVPLVESLEGGGSWRPFHPLDRVDLWIDSSTWFPLRYRISARVSTERAEWARANDVADKPGGLLLDVRAESFQQPDRIAAGVFRVPASGTLTSDHFRPDGVDLLGTNAPRYLAGLEPYRAGRASGATLLAYTQGLNWLKVTISKVPTKDPTSADPAVAEEVRLGPREFAYYRPAQSAASRSVDIYGRSKTAHLESNLPRGQLLEVAASMPLSGRRVEPGPATKRVDASSLPGFALTPRYLPRGYSASDADAAVIRSPGGGRVTTFLFYRSPEAEYDGVGIRITQKLGARLAPTSEQVIGVTVDGVPARWSVERGELEWMDGGVYRAVSASSFDLATALAIARSLG
jgi:outer membrane lipoprotein-sorting protein